MNTFILQPHAGFPTASTCTKILIDAIVASGTQQSLDATESLMPATVGHERSTYETMDTPPYAPKP